MKKFNVKIWRNFWIYTTCVGLTILILFGLNWLLKLPSVIDIIGDENTWLPIVADSIVSGIIFIAGNWFSNADRLRNDIASRKRDFQLISNAVSRVTNSLNISRKQRSILYSIEISMDSPALIKEVMSMQQEIDEAQQEFKQVEYLITSKDKVAEFNKCVKTISSSYHIVFDSMQQIFNKWISTVASSTEAKTVADYIGKDNDKSKFALQYVSSCKTLNDEKTKLLKLYDSQKTNVDLLYNSVIKYGKGILDSEHNIIHELEKKL